MEKQEMNSRWRWKVFIGNNFDQVFENDTDKDPLLGTGLFELVGKFPTFVNDLLTNILKDDHAVIQATIWSNIIN